MCEWLCYLLMSLDSNCTYIGSTNNFVRRLNNHNNNDPSIKRKGAKRTRGQTWIPILIVTGFHHKNACLSFESGWKRLSHHRALHSLSSINQMTQHNLSYGSDPKWNRIMDLLYFVHNFTFLDTKFMLNREVCHPINQPEGLVVNIFLENWIMELPWPHFIGFDVWQEKLK